MQGTNRPARFNVLVDDRNIGPVRGGGGEFGCASVYTAWRRQLPPAEHACWLLAVCTHAHWQDGLQLVTFHLSSIYAACTR
jgi:hypothetical protein